MVAAFLLVITSPHGDMTTLPYRTRVQCVSAKAEIDKQQRENLEEKRRRAESFGYRLLLPSPMTTAFCVRR
jgi:hypothetical protein